ncbi:hypothetical protein EST38_g6057 [Candolleomyces aberdarensis]|uniref:Uncharacterized protein n=1 Tax=Candolleomyces aberdarensis TaxID=2316362 RepID=A0A4Q2DKT9_9AGAR|nr:hypothetical protein EST38_g6057 [Candolleomyces aberdarensis]
MASSDEFLTWYNNLPSVEDASLIFTNRDQWFQRIGPLLAKDENKPYALTLVHRHFLLGNGERMIATGLTTKPEAVQNTLDTDVQNSSWNSEGWGYEWQRVKTPRDRVPPPNNDLIVAFQKIFEHDDTNTGKVLGLALRPEPLAPDYVWWETTRKEARELVIEQKRRSDITDPQTFETCWIPQLNPETMEVVMKCCGTCYWPSH